MSEPNMGGERQHALLSASGAYRWLSCTPSAKLEEQFLDSTSTYAAEGSLAHEIGELKLRKKFVEPMGPVKFKNRLKKMQESPLYHEEMLRYTDDYVDYVSSVVHGFSLKPYMAVEKKVDLSTYVPESFGTGDCIIIGGESLYIIDLKYGKGVPVSAFENPQMMLYALGAYSAYSMLYPIKNVKMVIFQPRLDSVSEYEMAIEDLLAWGESVRPVAAKAYAGEGEHIPGEHCNFCRAKANCRARADVNLLLAKEEFKKPPLLSDSEIGEILIKAKDLAKWAKDLEEYALSTCISGGIIPGWKIVEGRSVRAVSDIDKAIALLKASGWDEEILYERKPLPLTKLEEVIGKKPLGEIIGEYIQKPKGKPTLAPESDKREAYENKTSAEEDFKTNSVTKENNGGIENGK